MGLLTQSSQTGSSQSGVSRLPSAEMQMLSSYPGPAESETLKVVPSNLGPSEDSDAQM